VPVQPFGWELPYPWPRKPVLASNVVCTSQPLAAQAGLRMLAEGGSAVDAAIATAIALTVVEPVSNGIGSDAFAIVWDGRVEPGPEARLPPSARGASAARSGRSSWIVLLRHAPRSTPIL